MKHLLVALFVIWSSLSSAQKTIVTLSPEFKLKEKGITHKEGNTYRLGNFYYTIAQEYSGVQLAYTAKLNKVRYAIQLHKYDLAMNEVKEKSMGAKSFDFGPFPCEMVLLKDKIFLFYYKFKGEDSYSLSLLSISPDDLGVLSDKELYSFSQKNTGIFKMAASLDNNSLLFYIKPDSSGILVSQSGNNPDIFTAWVNANGEVKEAITVTEESLKNFNAESIIEDKDGNRFISFSYKEDKILQAGIMMIDKAGKKKLLKLDQENSLGRSSSLSLTKSKYDDIIYAYGTYGSETMDEGILLFPLNPDALSAKSIKRFPYPEDIAEKFYEAVFGGKVKGKYTIRDIDNFKAYEMEDKTMILTGYPVKSVEHNSSFDNRSRTTYHAGPVINAFIKGGKCSFGVLYRSQYDDDGSGCLAIPFGDKLVCIYNDAKKNIASQDPSVKMYKSNAANDVVLAEAVFSNTGKLLSRKELVSETKKDYFLSDAQLVGANKFIVPVGNMTANLMRVYKIQKHWATLEVK